MSRPIAIFLALAGFATAGKVQAQYVIWGRQATQTSRMAYPGPTTYSSGYSMPATASTPTRVYHYSYYVPPQPARTYVPYGNDEFPFHGAPYGHPYDAWTWIYLSGSYGNGLARYYDPPVK